MKKILGYFTLLIIFLTMFVANCIQQGFIKTAAMWTIALGVVCLLKLAIEFITE